MELFRVIRIIFFSDIRFLLKFQWFRGETKAILKAFSKIIVFFFLFIKFLSNLHRIVCNIDKYTNVR